MTEAVRRARGGALWTGLAGLAACAVGAAVSPEHFFRSYLFGYVFWLGVALGCLAIVLIHHVTGGAWGLVIRRLLESATRTIPVMAILFVPLLFGIGTLYEWSHADVVAKDPLLQHKQAYLNVPFFIVRTVLYFIVWSALAWVLSAWSRRQDETGDPRLVRRFQMLGAGGLLLFVLTMTFASVDWLMSLEPHWFSTIYGILIMAGQAVSAFCVAIAALILLSRFEPLSKALRADHIHDLSKMLFTTVLVWAYFAFSQFIIVWSGNLPEETPWYLRRMSGGWQWVGFALIMLHFGLPFMLLLSRRIKRDPRRLMGVVALVFAMRLIDLHWMIAPAFSQGSWSVHWLDVAAPVGVGGIWIFLWLGQLTRAPLLPMRDPYLAEALEGAHD